MEGVGESPQEIARKSENGSKPGVDFSWRAADFWHSLHWGKAVLWRLHHQLSKTSLSYGAVLSHSCPILKWLFSVRGHGVSLRHVQEDVSRGAASQLVKSIKFQTFHLNFQDFPQSRAWRSPVLFCWAAADSSYKFECDFALSDLLGGLNPWLGQKKSKQKSKILSARRDRQQKGPCFCEARSCEY